MAQEWDTGLWRAQDELWPTGRQDQRGCEHGCEIGLESSGC